jgi:hypothetical protein
MSKAVFAMIAAMMIATPVFAAAPADPAAPVRQFIDGFNSGDTKAAFAAYAPGDVAIIDEFAPHHWIGAKAPQAWAAAYDANAKATGVTEGIVKYAKPTRIEIAGKAAYVVVPTVYTYKQKGKPMVEEGSITASLTMTAAGWKMNAWTWSGVKPHAPK